ncbi:MAG: 3-hydroxybutyrate dehydrogenase [Rickettsiaceae bacterium]|nr:3-hydroxybutyrate dehydrogenase [Rickettsiaceae bacterium]
MLKGKNAIVTGSTSGIGLAIATSLAEAGANIVFNGFGEKSAIDKLIDDFQSKYNVNALFVEADLKYPEKIRNLTSICNEQLGSVDILVNNAGIQYTSPAHEFPNEKWDEIIAINLSAAFHTIKSSLPYMYKQKFGRIINIASAHGLVASVNKVAYVAAKHGINGLTKVVALEAAESGVTCNSICPGWVLTPLVQKQIENIAINDKISIEEASDKLLSEKQPNKKFIKPENLGALVCFLCSPHAESMTGEIISFDGGWTAR